MKNPLTMVGLLRNCWLFAYGTPVEEARRLLPASLEPVVYGGAAFWNVVVCRIEGMRPKGVPPIVGFDYWHVAYRLYVRFRTKTGEPIEGLYFLRSDCDSRLMAAAGNLVTDFNFNVARIRIDETAEATQLTVESPTAPVQVLLNGNVPSRPADSVFKDGTAAAAALKYKPFGISILPDGNANIVRIIREESAWVAHEQNVVSATWGYFHDKKVRFEGCYRVDPIQYQWNRGEIHAASGSWS